MDMESLKFTTDVEVDIDYDSEEIPGYEYESRSSRTRIKYEAYIELREWGIKNIGFMASAQEIVFDGELLSKDDKGDIDPEEVTFKIKIEEIDTDTSEMDLGSGDISATEITLTLKDLVKENEVVRGTARATLRIR